MLIASEKLQRRDRQRVGELQQVGEAHVALAALDPAHVRAVKPGLSGEPLL